MALLVTTIFIIYIRLTLIIMKAYFIFTPLAELCVPQLGGGQPHGRQGGHQEAVPALSVRAVRQARLPRAAPAEACLTLCDLRNHSMT